MYIPNTQKWINYYQNLGKNDNNPYINYAHRGGKQIGGGSLSGSSRQFITPIGSPRKGGHSEKVAVKLVSPIQQSIDQAKDEVERNQQGIKRKRLNKSVSPTRKRQRRQTKKTKKVTKTSKKKLTVTRLKKKSTVKRLKKKSTVKRLKTPNKKLVKKQTKKKILKSSFKDIFSK